MLAGHRPALAGDRQTLAGTAPASANGRPVLADGPPALAESPPRLADDRPSVAEDRETDIVSAVLTLFRERLLACRRQRLHAQRLICGRRRAGRATGRRRWRSRGPAGRGLPGGGPEARRAGGGGGPDLPHPATGRRAAYLRTGPSWRPGSRTSPDRRGCRARGCLSRRPRGPRSGEGRRVGRSPATRGSARRAPAVRRIRAARNGNGFFIGSRSGSGRNCSRRCCWPGRRLSSLEGNRPASRSRRAGCRGS